MKIAVYTIALNEEQFVQKWYDSAKDADYLLIADTGSTDKTKRLAKRLGINVIDISIKPFRFDDARNAALAALPKDIDVCISLDMDEVLSEGWREDLESKKDANKIVYKYTWSWKNDEETIPEYIFTNDKIHSRYGFRWRGLIHEYLVPDRTEMKIENCEVLEIHHHPDANKSRKSYDQLVELAMKEDPHSSRYVMYHARTLMNNGNHLEAKKLFENLLTFKDLSSGDRSFIYRSLSIYDKSKTVYFLKKCIEADTTRREGYVLLASYYFGKKRWNKVYKYAKLATEITKKRLDMATDNFAWGYLPYNLLAVGRNNKNIFKKKLGMKLASPISLYFDLFGEVKNTQSEDKISI